MWWITSSNNWAGPTYTAFVPFTRQPLKRMGLSSQWAASSEWFRNCTDWWFCVDEFYVCVIIINGAVPAALYISWDWDLIGVVSAPFGRVLAHVSKDFLDQSSRYIGWPDLLENHNTAMVATVLSLSIVIGKVRHNFPFTWWLFPDKAYDPYWFWRCGVWYVGASLSPLIPTTPLVAMYNKTRKNLCKRLWCILTI